MQWPANMTVRPIQQWPGELTAKRRRSSFKAGWSDTIELLGRELRAIAAKDVVLQVAMQEKDFRIDGYPRAQAKAAHPGVILSLGSNVGPLSWPCDTFDSWQDNIRGIALSMEALRKVDRYGVTKRGEQYTGWQQFAIGRERTADSRRRARAPRQVRRPLCARRVQPSQPEEPLPARGVDDPSRSRRRPRRLGSGGGCGRCAASCETAGVSPHPRGVIPAAQAEALLAARADKLRTKAADDAALDRYKAAVVAALLAGGSVREVAKLSELSATTVEKWGRAGGWPSTAQQEQWAADRQANAEWRAKSEAARKLIQHMESGDDE